MLQLAQVFLKMENAPALVGLRDKTSPILLDALHLYFHVGGGVYGIGVFRAEQKRKNLRYAG